MNNLDPFQDDKASYRMTTYINWIVEGFKQGLDRNTILADAAGRYAQQWGSDKIYQQNDNVVTQKYE